MTTSLEDVLERTLQCLKSEQGQSIKIQKGSQGSVTGPLMLNGKKVALKVYDYVDSPYVSKVIEDFQRECENLKTLSHPSIVRIIDFDHSPSSHAAYLRMEWASTELSDKGGAIDLNDIICSRDGLRGQPVKSHLPESFIWHTLFHLSAALVLCHYGIEVHRKQSIENTDANRVLSRLMEDPTPDLVDLSRKHPTITWNTEQISFSVRKQHEPIVHRDIKPRNVLLSDPPSEGHDKHWRPQITLDQNTLLSVYPIVLLGDFGLSAPVSVAQTRGIGSYGFRAPEVPIAPHRPGEAEFRWTGSCDIYSMGATLWSLMTLRPPPEDTTNIDWELPSVYSWELRNLISQCHAYDPASRPTAVDLLDACIHRAYWNETYVSPYGILIRPDFQCTIQRSWNEVLRQLRMGRETVNTVKHTESVVSDNFAALMKKPSGNSLSIFIAGAYQHHIFGRKLPPRTRKRPRLPKKPKVVIQQMGSDDTPPHVSNDGMHVEKDEETPRRRYSPGTPSFQSRVHSQHPERVEFPGTQLVPSSIMLLLLHILVHLLRKLILCYSRVAKFDNVLLRHRNHDSDFTGSQNILEEGREDTAMLFHPTDPHMRRRRVPHTRRRRVGGARLYLLVATVAAIIFTIIFSLFGAYMTGRHRLRCTKGIIFMATVLVSTFTVIAMILARRTLQEALLAGLLESVTGFVLVLEVHDFVTS